MKKIFLIVLALVFVSVPAFAVDSTMVCTDKKINFESGVGHKVQCTATASGTAFTTLEVKNAAGESINLAGQFLYLVSVVNGATGPTNDTDLVIREDSATGIDILGGSGTNMIDNAATNTFRPVVTSVAASPPIMGPLFIGASNNSVSSAIFVITLWTVPRIP